MAAATTSLPEALGGNRNWDYRYCWLRDATLDPRVADARRLLHTRRMAWRDWLLRAVAGDVSKLQIMYGPAGERRLDEWEVAWLPGYEGSAPVRIGNAASGQYQLDVYGEVMSALYSLGQDRGRAQPGRLGPADAADRVHRERLDAARRRHLGGARAAAPLHPLQGHGLGGRRPRRAHARGVARPRGAARASGGRCATRSSPRSARRATTTRSGLHPVLRVRRARRQRPDDPPRRLPPARRPAGGEHGRGDPARADGPRVRAALPDDRRRGGRRADRPGGRVPGLLVLAGGLPAHDRPGRGGARRSSSACWRCATTSGCCPRSTTRWPGAWSATFPRPSPTSR